jgi:hypothetical protein
MCHEWGKHVEPARRSLHAPRAILERNCYQYVNGLDEARRACICGDRTTDSAGIPASRGTKSSTDCARIVRFGATVEAVSPQRFPPAQHPGNSVAWTRSGFRVTTPLPDHGSCRVEADLARGQ